MELYHVWPPVFELDIYVNKLFISIYSIFLTKKSKIEFYIQMSKLETNFKFIWLLVFRYLKMSLNSFSFHKAVTHESLKNEVLVLTELIIQLYEIATGSIMENIWIKIILLH